MTAILTGDIVNSRENINQATWLAPLKKLLNSFGKGPEQWEIYRGDSFQLEIKDPEKALLSALKIKALIKGHDRLDVRIAIGIGQKTYKASRITESNGEAFIFSGETFNKLGKQKRTIALKTPWADFDETMDIMLRLASIQMDKWTALTADIVKTSLDHPEMTQLQIAKILKKKSQSDISEGRRRAAFDEITTMEAYFRTRVTKYLS